MAEPTLYRLDELRRFAAHLAAGVGVAPDRAATLGSLLLWFDAMGVPKCGIAALPAILDAALAGDLDPRAEGRITAERSGTTVLDGGRGVPLLILERAARLATEKARDVGIGLVQVLNIAAPASAAVVAAEAAIGPNAAVVVGPGPTWSLALPSEEGLPALFGSDLGGERPEIADAAPWLDALAPGSGWLVAAVAVHALEPLSAFHERVSGLLGNLNKSSRGLRPGMSEDRRRKAREQGVRLAPAALKSLKRWADRLNVPPPAPISARSS